MRSIKWLELQACILLATYSFAITIQNKDANFLSLTAILYFVEETATSTSFVNALCFP